MKKVLILLILLMLFPKELFGLNVKTHRDINKRVVTVTTPSGFNFDTYLINQLGLSKGKDEELSQKKTVQQWLEDGGEYEDIPKLYLPYVRSLNHFHNPITEEGLKSNCLINLCLSSTIWMLMPVGLQSPTTLTGNYSWYDVRDYYYKGLTSIDKTTRDTNFAETFRGLGQVMHLVQDVSVPAHTRDDAHLFYNYEKWVGDNVNINNLSSYGATFFNGFINNGASFIDTNQYNGTNPNDTASNIIGLSEYSNANFVSEGLIAANFQNFPYPDITQTTITERTAPSGNYQRQYYLKNCCGETNNNQGYLLSAVDYLDYYRQQYPSLSVGLPKIPILDNNVYSDYASLLLPRAVGYSAGLLNYFFRGTLEITAPDTYVYSIIDGSINPQQFTKIKAKVKNTTPNEQIQAGVLQAVAKYKIIPNYKDDLSDYPPPPSGTAMQNTPFSYSVSAQWTLSSNEISSINTSPVEFTFDFTNNPIPAGITDLYLFVVFKGTLGNETDTAIAVGMKDIIEPTHHVIWNLTDMFVLYYQEANDPEKRYHLYTAEQIKSRTELAELVDYGEKGIFDQVEIGEPYIDPHDITVKIAYLSNPPDPLNPIPINPIAEVVLPGGKHIRLITLLDNRKDNNNTHYYRITWWDKKYDPQPGQLKRWFPICGNSKDLINSGDDINNEGFYCDYTYSRVQDQEEGSLFKYQEASSFRYWGSNNPIKQHRMDSGVLRFSPLPSGEWRYPEEEAIPADKTPEKATINFK